MAHISRKVFMKCIVLYLIVLLIRRLYHEPNKTDKIKPYVSHMTDSLVGSITTVIVCQGRAGASGLGRTLTFMSRSGEEEALPLMALAGGGSAGAAGACHSLTALAARRRRRGRSADGERSRLPRAEPPPSHEPPPLPAASFLTIICVLVFYHHYSLVLFYVLSSASRSHRRHARRAPPR